MSRGEHCIDTFVRTLYRYDFKGKIVEEEEEEEEEIVIPVKIGDEDTQEDDELRERVNNDPVEV